MYIKVYKRSSTIKIISQNCQPSPSFGRFNLQNATMPCQPPRFSFIWMIWTKRMVCPSEYRHRMHQNETSKVNHMSHEEQYFVPHNSHNPSSFWHVSRFRKSEDFVAFPIAFPIDFLQMRATLTSPSWAWALDPGTTRTVGVGQMGAK